MHKSIKIKLKKFSFLNHHYGPLNHSKILTFSRQNLLEGGGQKLHGIYRKCFGCLLLINSLCLESMVSCNCWFLIVFFSLPSILMQVVGLNVARLICQDISNGLDRRRVPASNIVDKHPQPPTSTLQLVALMNQELFINLLQKVYHLLCRIERGNYSLIGCIHFRVASNVDLILHQNTLCQECL